MSPQGLCQRTPQQLKADQLPISSHSDVDNDFPLETRLSGGKLRLARVRVYCTRALFAFSLTRVSLSVFRVPTTHDVITALFHSSYPKSHIDILNLGLLATLSRTPPQGILLSLSRVLACRVRR